jgi:CPA2 family monovalent cation:H+ antiporter-2
LDSSSQLWGWPAASGIVFGLAISIASTVVLLRGLTDHGLLNTQHGQAAVGWVVVEDLATVLILVLMPSLADASKDFAWQNLGLTLIKAAAFVVLVVFAGVRLIPWVLLRIAHTAAGYSSWRSWPSHWERRAPRFSAYRWPWAPL